MQHYDSHSPRSSAAGDSLVQAASLKGRDRVEEVYWLGLFLCSCTSFSPVTDLARPVVVLSSTKNPVGCSQLKQPFPYRLAVFIQTPWRWEATFPGCRANAIILFPRKTLLLVLCESMRLVLQLTGRQWWSLIGVQEPVLSLNQGITLQLLLPCPEKG